MTVDPGTSDPDRTTPDDEVDGEPVDVLPLVDAVVDSEGGRRAWCPACGPGRSMRYTVTLDGTRYDHCTSCGLLWRVDRELDAVVGTRLVLPRAVGLP